ncbi:MAG: YqgE/AlgH family protein [Xanthobacteraceae bacterium]
MFLDVFRGPSGLVASMLATILAATLPASTAVPQQRASLVGQLLIASPAMRDPRFYQTVIVLVRHDRTGAMGIVVNRPWPERPFATLLEALGEKSAGAAGTVRVFAGGPVQPELGFVVHSGEYQRAGTMVIDDHLAVTSSREILRDLARHQGPRQSLVAFGYAGWGPGQLDSELGQGSWFTAPADAKLVFEEDRDRVWEDAMARRTQDL